MNKRKYIFIAFTVNSSSLAEFFIGLVKKMSQEFNVVIFTDKKPNILIDFNENVEILRWPSKRPTNFKDAFFLYRKIKKHKPIMSISMFGSVNVMLLIGWLTGVPNRIAWIRTLSTQYEQNVWLVKRKKLVYKLSSHIFVNSNATKLDSQSVYGIPENKIAVLQNSIKKYHRFSGINPNIKSHIAYAGRLHNSKGIDTLLKAFNKCYATNKDIHLDIIGEGPEKDRLLRLTKKLNIHNSVTFHSNQPKKKVMEFFENAYMTIVPSIKEAFGYVTIEAMSVKTPVIGSNTSGIKEIIRHQKDGLLFEPEDVNELHEKMNILLRDEAYAKKLGEQGYERFINTYEHQKSVNRDWNVLKKIVEDSI